MSTDAYDLIVQRVAEHLGVKTPCVPATTEPSTTKNSSSSRAPKNAPLPGETPGTGGKNAKVTHMRHFSVPHSFHTLSMNCSCGTSRLAGNSRTSLRDRSDVHHLASTAHAAPPD